MVTNTRLEKEKQGKGLKNLPISAAKKKSVETEMLTDINNTWIWTLIV